MKKILLFIIMFTIFNINDVKAAFDLQTKNATYDSNTGIVTIYDNKFSNKEYKAYISKMKLGNVILNGSYEFKEGILKLYLRNKNEVNNQIDFTKNNTIKNALNLEYGAIINSYRPPNSINVVLESYSNAKSLNIDTIGLKPKLSINNFTSNILTFDSNGGEAILTVNGDNLENAKFKVHQLNTSIKYDLNITNTKATVKVAIPANHSENDIIKTFVLYINDLETDKRVNILVSKVKNDSIISSDDLNNNESNNTNNIQNNNQLSNNNNSQNSNQLNNNNSQNNNQSNDANNSQSNNQLSNINNNQENNIIDSNVKEEIKQNDSSKKYIKLSINKYIIMFLVGLVILIIGFTIYITKIKKVNKKEL